MREHNRLCDTLGKSIRSKFMTHDEQFELIRKVRPPPSAALCPPHMYAALSLFLSRASSTQVADDSRSPGAGVNAGAPPRPAVALRAEVLVAIDEGHGSPSASHGLPDVLYCVAVCRPRASALTTAALRIQAALSAAAAEAACGSARLNSQHAKPVS